MLKINFSHAIYSVLLFVLTMALSGIFDEIFWAKTIFFIIACIALYWAIWTLLTPLNHFSSWIKQEKLNTELKGNINEKSI